MSDSSRIAGRSLLAATVATAVLFVTAIAGAGSAGAASVCALVPDERMQSEKDPAGAAEPKP